MNHIDVAARYGDAELRLAALLAERRDDYFLATKTGERTADRARKELERSLERMDVQSIDLWQLHNLADPIEWDTALSPGGALDAAVQARSEGLIRFIGVTGHGAQIAASHLRSLDRFDFDSVLLPYNRVAMQLPYYATNFEALAARCATSGTAVQTIKSLALRPWMGRERTHATWYEPLNEQSDIDLAVWWVLGREPMFLNSAGDLDLLPRILDAAERFPGSAPSDSAMAALEARVSPQPIFV